MGILKIFTRRNRRSATPPRYRRLLDAPQLRFVLRRERERSDRTERAFSFLVIELAKAELDDQLLARLDWIVDQRLRITDDAGVWQPGKIGIVLPETPASGAWIVAGEVLERLGLPTAEAHCTVYVYGTEGEDDTAGGSGRPVRSLRELLEEPVPAWKRAVDVSGAILGLLVLSPLLLLVAIAIRLTTKGPALFVQERTGLGGRPFMMYKFRTMVADADACRAALEIHNELDGPAFKMADDPRLTGLGRFLRRTSIDEVPQLWNVLLGQMTLVGPRPLPTAESAQLAPWQRRRLDVTPGLTCSWQVRGRGEVSFDDWMRMDLRYARRRTFWGDVKLLLSTVRAVVRMTGQ